MNQKTALAVIIALFVVFVITYISFESIGKNHQASVSTSTISNIPQNISIQGVYTCLPWKDTTSPHTMECALGIKTDNNIYYAIDAQGTGARNMLLSLQTGIRIQIDGVLVPADQLNTNVWQKYDIGGIVSTDNIKRI